jgi:hypothetical protein
LFPNYKIDFKEEKRIGNDTPFSFLIPSTDVASTEYKKDGNISIKSNDIDILLSKKGGDYEIIYHCKDAKKCLNFQYLKSDLELEFSGTLVLSEDGYEINDMKGNLNSNVFSGRISDNSCFLSFNSFNFDDLDDSKLTTDIYLEKPNYMTNIFESDKDVNIKIKSLHINDSILNNTDISYKEKTLKIISQNLDVFVRKGEEFSGYVKASSFPLDAKLFKDSPFFMNLETCDIDSIFVSRRVDNFSSLFFDLQSDFKLSCTNSNLYNFNFSNAIKSVYSLTQLSVDNISASIRKSILTPSKETSSITFQGQLNKGTLKILKFTSANDYGKIDAKGDGEFSKKKFSIMSNIELNYLGLTPVKMTYSNEGSIYKNTPKFEFNDVLGIQKYYLDSNRSKLEFLTK